MQKIYSRVNQLKDYNLPYKEEWDIVDFVMEPGQLEPTVKVVDKINYKKLAAAYEGQTDLELIKKLAKQKSPKDVLAQANYVATHVDQADKGVYSLEDMANNPTDAKLQIENLNEKASKSLDELPTALRSFIIANPNATSDEITNFVKQTYKEETNNG